MLFCLRTIATLLILSVLLTGAAAFAVASAWSVDPFSPVGVLVAPDQFELAGHDSGAYAALVPLQSESPYRRVITIKPPDGRQSLQIAGPTGLVAAFVPPQPAGRVVEVGFRASPEAGFGLLAVFSRLFVFAPGLPVAAVDLEGIRQAGRYQLDDRRRQWLIARLGGLQPVYLADVELAGYNELRAELEFAGWPAGPLLMWRRLANGESRGPDWIGRKLEQVRLKLALVGREADNSRLFASGSPGVKLIQWPEPPGAR